MSNLVIVAIPDENDRVWKVSSEQVPHLTVLFLGDVAQVQNLDSIIGFVEHAASTTLSRFYLRVDRRDVLGADEADVLFFKKGFDYKAIRDFRAALLQDNNIRSAYDAAEQFDGPWQPHLTLGYPAAPAKELPTDDSVFYDVQFNKIAVWVDDFAGPEFLLKDYWDEYETLAVAPMDLPMSALQHAAKVSDTPWSNFKDSDYDDAQYARACLLDRGADAGSAKQRYSLPVREPDGTLNRNGCHAAAAVLSSKGGTGSARGNKLKATPEQIAAAKKKLVSLYNGPLNEDVPEGLGGEMKQTAEVGAEFVLEHYGVKGMRWGVRKDDGSGGSSNGPNTQLAKVAVLGWTAPISPALRKNVSTATNVKVAAFGQYALLSPSVRSDLRQASTKVNLQKADKHWENGIKDGSAYVAVQNHLADHFNSHIDALNNKYPADRDWSHEDYSHPKDPTFKKYVKDVHKLTAQSIDHAVNQLNLDNPSGTKTVKVEQDPHEPLTFKMSVHSKTAKHAAGDAPDEITFRVKYQTDAKGNVVGFELDDGSDSMSQTVELGKEFLAHYGVKGMRWGVRRDQAVTTQTHLDTGLIRRRTKVVAKGGTSQPAHTDAVKAAVAKQVIKKSGTDALSTQELRDLANRLQVENQVGILMSSKGKQYVSRQLESEGKQVLRRGATKAAPHVLRKAKKAAAVGATSAALAL